MAKLSKAHDLLGKGENEEALKVLKEAFEEGVSKYGGHHVYTMDVQFTMADALERLLKYEEALQHSRELYRKNVLIFGTDHPRTLGIKSTIAMILEKQEKYDEALILYQEVYDKQEKHLGANHEETLITLNNLTGVHARQGKDVLTNYESLYQKMKEASPNSPNILTIQCNIADQLALQGQLAEALEIYREVNSINEYRPRHLDTLNCLDNTALLLSDQGKHNDALEISEKVLNTKLEMFGPNHPHTLNTLATIGTIENRLTNRKKFGERLAFLKEQHWKRLNALGPTHPETLIAQEKTAEVLTDLGEYDEALSIYIAIYEINKRVCPNHFYTYAARINIGIALCHLGKFSEALSIYKDMTKLQKNMASDHPEVLETQIRIAHTLGYLSKYEEALNILTKVSETHERQFGVEHKRTLTTRSHIASILTQQGKYDEALKIYCEILDIRKKSKSAGPDDDLTIEILHDIAFVYKFQGNLTEAYNSFSLVYAVELLNRNEDHPLCIALQNETVTILVRQGRYRKALEVLQEVYKKQLSVFGADHPYTLISRDTLKILSN